MRLKGGKVLLDLVGKIEEDISLSDEEITAILEKGLIIKIDIGGVIFTREVIFNNYIIQDDVLHSLSERILTDTNKEKSPYDIVLNLEDKIIGYYVG